MNVIVACEESQAVCIEFRKRGHNAFSSDIQKCSGGHPEWHIIGDCFELFNGGMFVCEDGSLVSVEKWDLLIGHPPCTYLSNAGNGWFDIDKYWLTGAERWENRFEAVIFFARMWKIGKEKIGKVCLENPMGYINKIIPNTQKIQPYYFGNSDMKTTYLWIFGLPNLIHTKLGGNLFGDEKTWVNKPEPIYVLSNGKKCYFTDAISGGTANSQKLRSKTFPGIAKAMANQWG